MNKYLKYALYSVGAVIAIFAAALTYIALTFDPNTYKPQIIQAVKDSKQRTLKLDGDIRLFFFPSIGARIGQVSLSEFRSEQEFASIGEASVSLAFLPLLAKHVVVDEVLLSGVKARVVKYKNGTTNLDDLTGKNAEPTLAQTQTQDASSPIQFDIASVSIKDAEFTYRDEGTGAQYSVKSLNLHTGRIANGVPSKIDFAAHILANQPKVDVTAQVKTTLTFDLEKNVYQIQGMDVQAKGAVLDITDLVLKLGLDASVNLGKQNYAAKKFIIAASGFKGKEKFETKLEVPDLSILKNDISVDGVALSAKSEATFGTVEAALSLPSIKGDMERLKLSGLTINIDVTQPEQAFKLKLSTPISANLKTQQFNLSDLSITLNATGEKMPGKNIHSELKGGVQADLERQSVQINLAGGLLQGQIKAKLGINNFSAPNIRYDLDIDQFDVDLYLPKSAETKVDKEGQATEPEQPFDLTALKSLNIDGSLRVGALKALNVKVKQLRVDMKAKDGVVKVAPFTASLYNGKLDSNIVIDASKSQAAFAANAKMSGVELGALMQDAMKMDFISGQGNVDINITSRGNMFSLLKKSLNGKLSVHLADGAVKGINLAKSTRDIGKGGDKTLDANKTEQTDFSELKASFKIVDGIAHNDDLMLKSPFVRLGGKGNINVGDDSLDYLVKATLAGTTEGQGGKDNVGGVTVPVRLSGPFSAIKYKLEFGNLISDQAKQQAAAATDAAKAKLAAETDAAKQKLQQAIEEQKAQAKAKAEAELKKGLGGMFK